MRPRELEQRLELGEPQVVLAHELIDPAADDLVEVHLDPRQDGERRLVRVHGLADLEQMRVALARGDGRRAVRRAPCAASATRQGR